MQDWNDNALLQEYAKRGSEPAFAELVARHINKVYSVALRHTRNPHLAEEITQSVFVILARKAGGLGKKVILEGWLYQTARLTALTAIRSEIRRSRREEEAHMQNTSNENETDVWKQIEPLLDSAMASLNEPDRHAVVLRYFYGKSMKDVGSALGGSEGAATLRLRRALEKLRRFFGKRGIRTTVTILTATIAANSVQAAPAMLTKSVTATAVAKGVAAGGSVPALVNGVLKVLAWAKVKFALGVTAAVVLAAAGGTEIYALNKGSAQKASRKHFIRSEWANEGFGSPEATVKTYFWAAAGGDVKVFADTSTKELSQFMEGKIFKNKAEQERTAVLIDRFKDIKGLTIDQKNEGHDGLASVKLSFDCAADPTFQMAMLMTNVEGNWKIATVRQFSGGACKEMPLPTSLTEADFAPRAGSDLQGYWTGAIQTPRGESKISLKVSEPSEEYYRGDFFNVEQAANRPAVISRDGTTVTVKPMWANGSFEGTLRPGGKVMEGKWIQGGRALPATLTRTNWVKP